MNIELVEKILVVTITSLMLVLITASPLAAEETIDRGIAEDTILTKLNRLDNN